MSCTTEASCELSLSACSARLRPFVLVATVTTTAAVLYAETVAALCQLWQKDAEYAHGLMMPMLGAVILWSRRHELPGGACQSMSKAAASGQLAIGMAVLLLALIGRSAALFCHQPLLAAWSIPLWLAAVALLFGGRRMLRWSSPALILLGLMMPLPFRLESWLAGCLQQLAARFSCWCLLLAGRSADLIGNVLYLDDLPLEVARSCSGLRLLTASTAVAVAGALVGRFRLRQVVLVGLAVLPLAIVANGLRIAATAVAYSTTRSIAVRSAMHDGIAVATTLLAVAVPVAAAWCWSLCTRRRQSEATAL